MYTEAMDISITGGPKTGKTFLALNICRAYCSPLFVYREMHAKISEKEHVKAISVEKFSESRREDCDVIVLDEVHDTKVSDMVAKTCPLAVIIHIKQTSGKLKMEMKPRNMKPRGVWILTVRDPKRGDILGGAYTTRQKAFARGKRIFEATGGELNFTINEGALDEPMKEKSAVDMSANGLIYSQ
jgi:hypothetical protein